MGVPPSYPFVLTQYYPFARSKYIPAQTTFRQLPDNLNYIYIYIYSVVVVVIIIISHRTRVCVR